MASLTGVLGTTFSRLGQFQLGTGPGTAEGGVNVANTVAVATAIDLGVDQGPWKRLVESVVVSPTIRAARDKPQSVTSSATIAQSVQPIASTARVTHYAVDIIYRKAPIVNLVETITVTSTGVRTGQEYPQSPSNSGTVSQTIDVAPRPRESVTDSITVTSTVAERSTAPHLSVTGDVQIATTVDSRDTNVRVSVTTPISVSQTLTPGPTLHFAMQDAVQVTSTVGERNTNVRLAVTSSVRTGQTATPGPSLHHQIEDVISVTSTPFGRNTNVRIGVTTSISASVPASGRDDHDRQVVQSTLSVAGQAKTVENRILIPETDNLTITGVVSFYTSPLQILLGDHLTVTDVLGGGGDKRRVSVVDQIAVVSTPNPKRPSVTVLDSISVESNGSGGGRSREVSVLQQVFTAGQALARSAVIHQALLDRIRVTHVREAQGPIVQITVPDAIQVQTKVRDTAPRHEALSDSILLAPEVVGRSNNPKQTVTDAVAVSLAIRKNIISLEVSDTIAITTRAWTPEIVLFSRIQVSQDPRRMFEASVTDSVSVAPAVGKQAQYNPQLADSLPIVETAVRGATLDRSIIHTLPIPDGMYKKRIFLPDPITVPVAVGMLVTNYTVLQAKNSAIVLPAPQLGDGMNNVDSVTIHRSMRGGAVVFKTTSARRSLRLQFRLDKVKAFELMTFLQANLSVPITMTTYDGQVWVVLIPKAPVEIQHAGRGADADEFATWEVEMEGEKISG